MGLLNVPLPTSHSNFAHDVLFVMESTYVQYDSIAVSNNLTLSQAR